MVFLIIYLVGIPITILSGMRERGTTVLDVLTLALLWPPLAICQLLLYVMLVLFWIIAGFVTLADMLADYFDGLRGH